MKVPLVSVIIPTYAGADQLGRAIRSVLAQSYTNLELLVVNDASPDHTDDVVAQFDDPRLIYLVHEQNQGVDHARLNALNVSQGEIIAFLDQDDSFHKEKLAEHVRFLEAHPEIGFTYNSYYNLHHSSDAIRDFSRPPREITLTDLVSGFPLPPSVWVMRREWATREEVWDETVHWRGSEITFCGRLMFGGLSFWHGGPGVELPWLSC